MKQLEHLFVRSEKEFRSYQYLVGNVFDQNRRLPQQVFRKNFDCFLFQEFDWALSDDILTSIKQLSNLTKDREFLTAVLQPDPVEYYGMLLAIESKKVCFDSQEFICSE
ncbi:hypothetical protein [Bacillus sp. LLTC93]|uniref:hypothetical protein n=1 Tax=Bacillus sp. LLTC93 TaxID=2108274 RepID=UPI001CB94724|nr:hypothetical protein [Bacillus sp. LLTC93]